MIKIVVRFFLIFLIGFWIALPPALAKNVRQNVHFKISEKEAIDCILGEAGGEPWVGMVAVGEVLRRRGSMNGFVGCHAAGMPTASQRLKALKAWRRSARTNITKGALYFDGSAFLRPWWSKKMKKVCVIGHQIFWKP